MTNTRRLLATSLAALVLLLGSGFGVWRWRAAHKKPPVEFGTAAVDRGRIVARVTATGTLSALVTVQVGTQVSGTVQKLYVDWNSPVKKGQLIAKIDPQLFEASLQQAQANYEAAEGNLVKAEAQERDAGRQFERSKTLLDRKLIAQADYDTSQANEEMMKGQTASARGSLAQAKAALSQARVNLDMTKIVSPTDGTVISRSVDVGQTVAASLAAPTLFVIAKDLREMQVDTSVAEADVGRLVPGMAATFTVDAFPGERFRGKVRQIRNAPTTLQNVVTYDAVIDVANPDLKLRPGMTANITFISAEKDDVLRVPNAALRFRPTPEIFTALGMPVPAAVREAADRSKAGASSGGGTGTGAGSRRATGRRGWAGRWGRSRTPGRRTRRHPHRSPHGLDAARRKAADGLAAGRPLRREPDRAPGRRAARRRRGDRRRLGHRRSAGGGRGGSWRDAAALLTMPLIELDKVSKVYRMGDVEVHAMREVSLVVEERDFVAVMGSSGSGKSTLMNIIGCLDRPSTGAYRLDGDEVSRLDRRALAGVRNKTLGFVFQSFNLLSRTSALENVELPLLYGGVPARERHRRALEALGRVGLAERVHHRSNEMSGGQQQRVAVARALVTHPRLILADEPTGNLDSRTTVEIMVLFQELAAAGITVLLVTHEPDVAAYASRVVVMRDGRVRTDTRQDPRQAAVDLAAAREEDPHEAAS